MFSFEPGFPRITGVFTQAGVCAKTLHGCAKDLKPAGSLLSRRGGAGPGVRTHGAGPVRASPAPPASSVPVMFSPLGVVRGLHCFYLYTRTASARPGMWGELVTPWAWFPFWTSLLTPGLVHPSPARPEPATAWGQQSRSFSLFPRAAVFPLRT